MKDLIQSKYINKRINSGYRITDYQILIATLIKLDIDVMFDIYMERNKTSVICDKVHNNISRRLTFVKFEICSNIKTGNMKYDNKSKENILKAFK